MITLIWIITDEMLRKKPVDRITLLELSQPKIDIEKIMISANIVLIESDQYMDTSTKSRNF